MCYIIERLVCVKWEKKIYLCEEKIEWISIKGQMTSFFCLCFAFISSMQKRILVLI